MMKCPLKPIKVHETAYGTKVSGEQAVATIKTDFGDCDLRLCMAYNAAKGICRMMIQKGDSQ